MASLGHFQMVERDFLRVVEDGGLPQPDEVRYHEDPDEIEVIWHEQKLVVFVELDEHSAAAWGDLSGEAAAG